MVIFSDLHAHNFIDHHDDRLGLIINSLEEILQVARVTKSPVLFCGDIVHKQGYVPTTVITELIKTFNKFIDVKVYAISGNHDQTTRNFLDASSDSFVHTLAHALPYNFFCLDWREELIGDYLVVGCPYLASPKDFDTVLTHFSNKFEAVGKSPHKRILMCHQTPTQIFNSFIPADFNIDDPRLDIFDYVFIGHIHRYQGFGNNRFMVGNPIVQDAGDFGDRKGYLYLKDGLVQHVQLTSPMDEIMVNVVDTRKQTVSKAEKIAHVDQRFYSDDFTHSFTAFCELAKLDQYTIEIGKQIISCQN